MHPKVGNQQPQRKTQPRTPLPRHQGQAPHQETHRTWFANNGPPPAHRQTKSKAESRPVTARCCVAPHSHSPSPHSSSSSAMRRQLTRGHRSTRLRGLYLCVPAHHALARSDGRARGANVSVPMNAHTLPHVMPHKTYMYTDTYIWTQTRTRAVRV